MVPESLAAIRTRIGHQMALIDTRTRHRSVDIGARMAAIRVLATQPGVRAS